MSNESNHVSHIATNEGFFDFTNSRNCLNELELWIPCAFMRIIVSFCVFFTFVCKTFVSLRFFVTSYRVSCVGLLACTAHQESEGPFDGCGSPAGLDSGPPPPEGQLDDSLSSSAIDLLQVVSQLPPHLGVAFGSVDVIEQTY
jgi:hypothetical protein